MLLQSLKQTADPKKRLFTCVQFLALAATLDLDAFIVFECINSLSFAPSLEETHP